MRFLTNAYVRLFGEIIREAIIWGSVTFEYQGGGDVETKWAWGVARWWRYRFQCSCASCWWCCSHSFWVLPCTTGTMPGKNTELLQVHDSYNMDANVNLDRGHFEGTCVQRRCISVWVIFMTDRRDFGGILIHFEHLLFKFRLAAQPFVRPGRCICFVRWRTSDLQISMWSGLFSVGSIAGTLWVFTTIMFQYYAGERAIASFLGSHLEYCSWSFTANLCLFYTVDHQILCILTNWIQTMPSSLGDILCLDITCSIVKLWPCLFQCCTSFSSESIVQLHTDITSCHVVHWASYIHRTCNSVLNQLFE